MNLRLFLLIAISLCFTVAAIDSSEARKKRKKRMLTDTGLAEAMHDVKNARRYRVCMVSHTHFGSADSHRTKKDAKKAAIYSWSDFTDLEYGSRWSNFRLADARKVSCNQASDGSWACDAEGRPCRKGRIKKKRRKSRKKRR